MPIACAPPMQLLLFPATEQICMPFALFNAFSLLFLLRVDTKFDLITPLHTKTAHFLALCLCVAACIAFKYCLQKPFSESTLFIDESNRTCDLYLISMKMRKQLKRQTGLSNPKQNNIYQVKCNTFSNGCVFFVLLSSA